MEPDAKARIDDLEQRIEELEETVATLTDDENSGTSDQRFDRYDEYVLGEIDDVVNAHPRVVMQAYGEAGIVNDSKQKQRTKRLKRILRE